jgi:hypothetical protein
MMTLSNSLTRAASHYFQRCLRESPLVAIWIVRLFLLIPASSRERNAKATVTCLIPFLTPSNHFSHQRNGSQLGSRNLESSRARWTRDTAWNPSRNLAELATGRRNKRSNANLSFILMMMVMTMMMMMMTCICSFKLILHNRNALVFISLASQLFSADHSLSVQAALSLPYPPKTCQQNSRPHH